MLGAHVLVSPMAPKSQDQAMSLEEYRREQREPSFGTVRVWGTIQQFALYWTSNEEQLRGDVFVRN